MKGMIILMIFQVYNRDIDVGNIDIRVVASSSLVLVGDVETIQLASIYDTPAESLIIGPAVPF